MKPLEGWDIDGLKHQLRWIRRVGTMRVESDLAHADELEVTYHMEVGLAMSIPVESIDKLRPVALREARKGFPELGNKKWSGTTRTVGS